MEDTAKENPGEETSEEEMGQALRWEISSSQSDSDAKQENETESAYEQENAEANPFGSLAIIINILGDAFDYIGIGAIPILGDILDTAIAGYNALISLKTLKEARWKAMLAAAIVPFIIETFGAFIAPVLNDLLPSYIAGSLIGRAIIKRVIKKAGLKNAV